MADDDPKRDFPAPRDLDAQTFELDGQDYVLFQMALPCTAVPAGLTRAEQDVVLAVAEGKTNAQIAALRGSSPRTIANQLASIYRKLNVTSRMELLALCFGEPQRRSRQG